MRTPEQSREGEESGYFNPATDEVTCQQFVELITDYFEGALPAGTVTRIEEHLVMCDWCVTYTDQMKAILASLQTLQAPRVERGTMPPSAALAALRQRRSPRR